MSKSSVQIKNKLIDYIKSFDLYEAFFIFLVFGFVGWIFETSVVWIMYGKITCRGYWFAQQNFSYYFPFLKGTFLQSVPFIWGLPIIEIYGLGGVIITTGFKKLRDHPIKLFLIGTVTMTIFEYVGSLFCEYVLQRSYWNYDDEFMNFQGRICLQSSIAWGALSVAAVVVFLPAIEKVYNHKKASKIFRRILVFLISYVVLCALVKYAINPAIISN